MADLIFSEFDVSEDPSGVQARVRFGYLPSLWLGLASSSSSKGPGVSLLGWGHAFLSLLGLQSVASPSTATAPWQESEQINLKLIIRSMSLIPFVCICLPSVKAHSFANLKWLVPPGMLASYWNARHLVWVSWLSILDQSALINLQVSSKQSFGSGEAQTQTSVFDGFKSYLEMKWWV